MRDFHAEVNEAAFHGGELLAGFDDARLRSCVGAWLALDDGQIRQPK